MVDILKWIDINIKKKIIKVNCIFHEYKIIMLIYKDIINIYYYYNTDETNIQYIIKTEKANILFNTLLIQGYNLIEQYLPYNRVDIPIIYNGNKFDNILVMIYKIFNGNKVEFRMSDKLKTLILIAYSKNKLYDNNIHEVYLINPEWLKQYNYKEIKSSIDDKFKQIQNLNIVYNNLNSVFEITRHLNQQNLKNFDNELVFISPNSTISFDCLLEELKLANKSILLFKEFVIVDKQILNHIEKSFGIIPSNNNISYIYKKGEGDLIIIKEYPLHNENPNRVENLIIFGKYDGNQFNIEYIFEYQDINILGQELKNIVNNNINYYINKRTNFDKSNKYSKYISSIISKNQIIGNCYRYKENIDYTKLIINRININSNNLQNYKNIKNF
jgi:hypothetical protein